MTPHEMPVTSLPTPPPNCRSQKSPQGTKVTLNASCCGSEVPLSLSRFWNFEIKAGKPGRLASAETSEARCCHLLDATLFLCHGLQSLSGKLASRGWTCKWMGKEECEVRVCSVQELGQGRTQVWRLVCSFLESCGLPYTSRSQ